MDCKLMREHMILHGYGELSVDEAGKLETHVKTCPDCQQFQANLERAQHALNQWPDAERPVNLAGLHHELRAKPRRRFLHWPVWRPLAWGLATCLVLALSTAALAWVGVDVKWKDRGLTLRMGQPETPEVTRADLVRLLEAQRQATQAETVRQIQAALTAFGEQLQEHLDERQQQTDAQIQLIYQALQSQRAVDVAFVRQEIQKLAGATETELVQAGRAIEYLLASHVEGMQGYPQR